MQQEYVVLDLLKFCNYQPDLLSPQTVADQFNLTLIDAKETLGEAIRLAYFEVSR